MGVFCHTIQTQVEDFRRGNLNKLVFIYIVELQANYTLNIKEQRNFGGQKHILNKCHVRLTFHICESVLLSINFNCRVDAGVLGFLWKTIKFHPRLLVEFRSGHWWHINRLRSKSFHCSPGCMFRVVFMLESELPSQDQGFCNHYHIFPSKMHCAFLH